MKINNGMDCGVFYKTEACQTLKWTHQLLRKVASTALLTLRPKALYSYSRIHPHKHTHWWGLLCQRLAPTCSHQEQCGVHRRSSMAGTEPVTFWLALPLHHRQMNSITLKGSGKIIFWILRVVPKRLCEVTTDYRLQRQDFSEKDSEIHLFAFFNVISKVCSFSCMNLSVEHIFSLQCATN